jgi:hypothetical protein
LSKLLVKYSAHCKAVLNSKSDAITWDYVQQSFKIPGKPVGEYEAISVLHSTGIPSFTVNGKTYNLNQYTVTIINSSGSVRTIDISKESDFYKSIDFYYTITSGYIYYLINNSTSDICIDVIQPILTNSIDIPIKSCSPVNVLVNNKDNIIPSDKSKVIVNQDNTLTIS